MCNFLCNFLIKFESTLKRKFKEQIPQLTLLYCDCSFRTSHQTFFYKIFVLKNFTISTGNIWVGVSFLKTNNFLKKKSQHECFPVSIATFSKLPVLKNICERLIFHCFKSHYFMDLKVQGLDCMTALGFRVQLTGVFFCFLS